GGVDLLQRAAGDDHLAVGEDRRGEGDVQRVGAGEPLGPRVDLPAPLPGRPLQRVEPAALVVTGLTMSPSLPCKVFVPLSKRRAWSPQVESYWASRAAVLMK